MKPIQITEPKRRRDKDKELKDRMSRIKHKIIVMSGKGGVGKTSVSVNLSYALALTGREVGLVDIDLHGPNIAKMLGVEGQGFTGSDNGIEPVRVLPNLKAASISFATANPDMPIIWRGPLKMSAIRQFLEEINWGELDYLVIDSPPGTGDEPLSACQLIPEVSGAVIVTTPQDVVHPRREEKRVFRPPAEDPRHRDHREHERLRLPALREGDAHLQERRRRKSCKRSRCALPGKNSLRAGMVEMADKGLPFVQSMKGRTVGRWRSRKS